MKKLLVLSGYDPTSGAGISSDIRTCVSLEVFPLPVVTVFTLQSDTGLEGLEYVSDECFRRSLEIACSMGPSLAKVGMVAERSKVEIISDVLGRYGVALVLDPVFSVTKGGYMASRDLVSSVVELLVPMSILVTPNIHELEMLTGAEDVEEGARFVLSKGARAVLVKGGDAPAGPVDRLFFDGRVLELKGKRLKGDFHGKGCVLSAAIASFVARGFSLEVAFKRAFSMVQRGLESPVPLKGNWSCPRSTVSLERARVLYDLRYAASLLEEKLIPDAIPEVGSNLCYALSSARDTSEVAGFPARIIKFKDKVVVFSHPEFGASSHVARLVLSAMKWREEVRSAMNIALREEFVERCERFGFKSLFVDRRKEPFRGREGGSMEWVTDVAFSRDPFVDVVYDRGDVGKEPMMRVFGLDPLDVVDKVLKITGRGGAL